MKARALEEQQERERERERVEVDDDEEQIALQLPRRETTRYVVNFSAVTEEQQQKALDWVSEEKVRVVWDGENVQVETVKTPIANDVVR